MDCPADTTLGLLDFDRFRESTKILARYSRIKNRIPPVETGEGFLRVLLTTV